MYRMVILQETEIMLTLRRHIVNKEELATSSSTLTFRSFSDALLFAPFFISCFIFLLSCLPLLQEKILLDSKFLRAERGHYRK